MTVGFLNAIPPVISRIVAMVWWSRHSDRTGERTWHVILACLAASIGPDRRRRRQQHRRPDAALTIVNVGISCARSRRCGACRRCSSTGGRPFQHRHHQLDR